MGIFVLISLTVLNIFISRYLYILILRDDITFQISRKNILPLFKLLSPILVKKRAYQRTLNYKYILVELITILNSILLYFALLNLSLLTILFLFISFYILSFLLTHDIIYFEIPSQTTRVLVILAILINILVIFIGQTQELFLKLGTIDNLITGVITGLIFYLIVKLTKEKGMGTGDIYLFMFIGLVFGWKLTLISITSTLLIASISGIIFTVFNKKLKNILIPLVPFITIGFLITLAFGNDISQTLFPFL